MAGINKTNPNGAIQTPEGLFAAEVLTRTADPAPTGFAND